MRKQKKAADRDVDDLVFCLLTMKKKENVKEKVRLVEDVKQPSDAGMNVYIDGDTFFLFRKNTWIGDSGASCHITNIDTGLFDIINFSELIQGSSGIIPAVKKGKLHINI